MRAMWFREANYTVQRLGLCCLRRTRQLEYKFKMSVFLASWRGQVAIGAVEPWGAPKVDRTFWYPAWKDREAGTSRSQFTGEEK